MVLAIEGIDRIAKDPFIYKYIDEAFGGIDTLKKSSPNCLIANVSDFGRLLQTCFRRFGSGQLF
jgi:hypothetical protein